MILLRVLPLALVLGATVVDAQADGSVDLSSLGTPSWEDFDGSASMVVDDDCMYTLSATFKLPAEYLSFGNETLCNPADLQVDRFGIPFLASRYRWESFPDLYKAASGFDHLSLDWNPCGHPGPYFSKPHYDAHFYRVTPEFRVANLQCDIVIPGTDVCDPTVPQTSTAGRGFFNVARFALSAEEEELANTPGGFAFTPQIAIERMGVHNFDAANQPLVADWVDPMLIVLSYNSDIVAFEPMVPYEFSSGSVAQTLQDDIEYVSQTINDLPVSYSVSYDPDTEETAIELVGKSNICRADFEAGNTPEEEMPDLAPLGEENVEDYDAEFDMSVDETCQYTLTVDFQTPLDSLPIGNATTCDPTGNNGGPFLDSTGIPFLASRYAYYRFPDHWKEASGYDHISIDWNPCGHPGPYFNIPHLDTHVYRVTPEFRAGRMVCDTIPGTPACDMAGQSTSNGRAFFNVARSSSGDIANAPAGYDFVAGTAVTNMGTHMFDLETTPLSQDWVDPAMIFLSYDAVTIASEPMMPMTYLTGSEDQLFSVDFDFMQQTIENLATTQVVSYSAATERTTISFKGPSNLCQSEFDAAGVKDPGDSGSRSIFNSMVLVSMAVATALLVMM